jgi:polysaccharide biosynthesis protein PslH
MTTDEAPHARLAVLIVTSQCPCPPRSGTRMRVYQLVRQLARHHDVTLLTYVDADQREQIEELRGICNIELVDWRSRGLVAKRLAQLVSLLSPTPYVSREIALPEMQHAIDDLCARCQFDVIQIESSLLSVFRFPAGPHMIINEHNVESEVHTRVGGQERSWLRKAFSAAESTRLRRFERASWRRAAGVAVTSAREAPIVLANAPDTAIAVVPNGVDLERFRPDDGATRTGTVVFNGSLDYRPNLDGAAWLVEEIWPLVLARRPDARLRIVGRGDRRDLQRLERPSVEVTGEVAELGPYLASAAVIAVPIRMGGGTRLKVIEGLAMGKAMVSTTLGCEGIAVRDGVHLALADEPATFASALTSLLGDRDRAGMLGRQGRALMEDEYSWDLAGRNLTALYARVTAHQT